MSSRTISLRKYCLQRFPDGVRFEGSSGYASLSDGVRSLSLIKVVLLTLEDSTASVEGVVTRSLRLAIPETIESMEDSTVSADCAGAGAGTMS